MEFSREQINTKERILEHLAAYPKAEAEDIFKYLFHSAFGCEHLLSSEDTALGYIEKEYASAQNEAPPLTEALDGDYSRVHLSWIGEGLSPKTLARIFFLSAKKEERGRELLEEKLEVTIALAGEGALPIGREDLCARIDEWRERGYGALHHSATFREEYRPAYRVVANKYAALLPLFARIDAMRGEDHLVVAIEGGSASGKSTLGEILQEVYGCDLFHTDDFFLRPEQRTAERLAEVGGNFDRERFGEEIVSSLLKGERVIYRPFDCSVQALGESVCVEPKELCVVEGVYSTHPALKCYYGLSVFLDIDGECQKKRILARNSQAFAKRFFEEWIPLENIYFSKTDIRSRVDMIIPIK